MNNYQKELAEIRADFDEDFVRDDNLLDKYGHDENGETQYMSVLIKDFITSSAERIKDAVKKDFALDILTKTGERIDKQLLEAYAELEQDKPNYK